MPPSPTWTIHVASLGAVSGGAVVWRKSGKLHIAPIVKASFAFVPGGVMTPVPAVPIRVTEQRTAPDGSIRESVDTAPELAKADVLFAGHACAPVGMPADDLTVRLAVRSSKGEMLVDKRLEVLGDRVFLPSSKVPDPEPFARIPLVYERAYGGPDHGKNPVGVGILPEKWARRRLPNVVHPAKLPRPGVEPAGFAPISYDWPARCRLLRTAPRRVLDAPIAEIPDGLDAAYFQAAPLDQQAPHLAGDETIILEGLHPQRGTLEMQLPGARGVAVIYLPDGSKRPILMVADTLFIDGDAERCTLTWRGKFPIPSEADLPATALAVGVELPGLPVTFPDRLRRPPPDPEIELHDVEPDSGRRRTVVMQPKPPPLPPRGGRQGTMVIEVPEAHGPPPLPPRGGRQSTMVIEVPEAPAPPHTGRQGTMVFTMPDPPQAPQAAENPLAGTMVIEAPDSERTQAFSPAALVKDPLNATVSLDPEMLPKFPQLPPPPAPPPPAPPPPALPPPRPPPRKSTWQKLSEILKKP